MALLLLSGAGLVGTGALASWDVTANVDSGALDTTSAGTVSLDSANSTASRPVSPTWSPATTSTATWT